MTKLSDTSPFSLQLRVRAGQQDRILTEPKFDGRGVPGEAHHQLGRHPVGETAVRAVGDPVRVGHLCALRIATAHLHRLQGNIKVFAVSFSAIL